VGQKEKGRDRRDHHANRGLTFRRAGNPAVWLVPCRSRFRSLLDWSVPGELGFDLKLILPIVAKVARTFDANCCVTRALMLRINRPVSRTASQASMLTQGCIHDATIHGEHMPRIPPHAWPSLRGA
jgi:hypothetical protein